MKSMNEVYDYTDCISKSYVDNFRAAFINGPNSAERKAIEAEKALEKKKKMKNDEYERSMRKFKENNRRYKEKKQEEILMKSKQQEEMKIKTKEKWNYIKSIKGYNSNKFKKEKEDMQSHKEQLPHKEIDNDNTIPIKSEQACKSIIDDKKREGEKKEVEDTDNDNENQREEETMKNKISIYQIDHISNEGNSNNNNDIIINEKEIKENSGDASINLRNQIDDIINITLQQQKIKPYVNSNDADNNKGFLLNDISSNLNNISLFRKKGFKSITRSSLSTSNKRKQVPSISLSNAKNNQKALQDMRFHNALKQILSERLGEKNIYLPNICSCGQLRINLETLISEKNISVYSVFNSNCANNCIYYKKRHEYEKSISDILFSVRDLTFEAFFNSKGK